VANQNTQGIDCGLGQQELWNGIPVMMIIITTMMMMMLMIMTIPEPQHGTNVNE
jgi:hypothetical protein